MNKFFVLLFFLTCVGKNLYAAEAGMPQLDPEYWASQAFWLIIIFFAIYILIAKIFIPKIKSNIDLREDKIRKDLDGLDNKLLEIIKKRVKLVDLVIKNKPDKNKINYKFTWFQR